MTSINEYTISKSVYEYAITKSVYEYTIRKSVYEYAITKSVYEYTIHKSVYEYTISKSVYFSTTDWRLKHSTLKSVFSPQNFMPIYQRRLSFSCEHLQHKYLCQSLQQQCKPVNKINRPGHVRQCALSEALENPLPSPTPVTQLGPNWFHKHRTAHFRRRSIAHNEKVCQTYSCASLEVMQLFVSTR